MYQTIPWYSWILKCLVLSVLKGKINGIFIRAIFAICTIGIHSSNRWIPLISPSKTFKTKHLRIQLYHGIVWKIDKKNWAWDSNLGKTLRPKRSYHIDKSCVSLFLSQWVQCTRGHLTGVTFHFRKNHDGKGPHMALSRIKSLKHHKSITV